MDQENLGERVREARRARDLSQEALAREAGVSLNLVNKLERGVIMDPHYSTLYGLASALAVSVEDLAGREPVPLGEAPREAGPTLLEQGLDAARHDEEKDLRAMDRLNASEGTPQVTHSYEEDEFRTTLRERGYPDEDFESFVWPLIVMARRAERLEQEIARLQEERAQEEVTGQ